MRCIICAILLLLSPTVYGQNLTLEELIKIRSQDVGTANSFLSAKGWDLMQVSDEKNKSEYSAVWAFGRTPHTEKATAFLELQVVEGVYKKVRYQAPKTSYDLVRARVVAINMEQVSSKVEDGAIINRFVGANYRVECIVKPDKDTDNTVHIMEVEKLSEIKEYMIYLIGKMSLDTDAVDSTATK